MGKEDVQGQPAHGVGGIELLGDGDEGDLVLLEDCHEPGKVQQRAGKAIELVDDHGTRPGSCCSGARRTDDTRQAAHLGIDSS